MSDVWFTSDTHFGHQAMVENGWRPQYASVKEMNQDLVERWNEVVKPADSVWHLGDVFMGSQAEGLALISQLNGAKHLITGNHDKPWPGNRDSHRHVRQWMEAGFETIQAFARRRVAGQVVVVSHFPYTGDHTDDERCTQFRLRDEGLPLFHGHVHDAWRRNGQQINVGVDVRGFRPVHIDELAAEL